MGALVFTEALTGASFNPKTTMPNVRFKRSVDEMHVLVDARITMDKPDYRSYSICFDTIKKVDTGEPVSPEWFGEHEDLLAEIAVEEMKNDVHRARNPPGV